VANSEEHVDNEAMLCLSHQGDLCNLEKADILELTVNHLRQMIASTERQYSVGYGACVQEVNNFLRSFRYNDVTRQRIVRHLYHQRPVDVTSGTAAVTATSQVNATRRVTDSSNERSLPRLSPIDYEHLRMCSYSSAADSTTGGGECHEDTQHCAITTVNYPIKCISPTPDDEPDQSCGNALSWRSGGAALANENERIRYRPSETIDVGDSCKDLNNNNTNNDIVDYNYKNDDNRVVVNDLNSCVWRPW